MKELEVVEILLKKYTKEELAEMLYEQCKELTLLEEEFENLKQLEKENFGLRQQVANLKEKDQKRWL